MKLSNFKARYHRNGVCGAGFYLCSFTYARENLMATVVPDGGEVNVFNPADIGDKFRGEYFDEALRACITTCGDEAFECGLVKA